MPERFSRGRHDLAQAVALVVAVMRPASAKQKGRRLQQMIAADVVAAFGLDPADVLSRSSGAGGTDVHLSPRARAAFPYGVECKNVERVNIWQAMEQARANAARDGLTPIVVLSRNRNPEPLAVVVWPAFLRLLQQVNTTRGDTDHA